MYPGSAIVEFSGRTNSLWNWVGKNWVENVANNSGSNRAQRSLSYTYSFCSISFLFFIDLLHFKASFPLAGASFCWEVETLWFQLSRWIDVLAGGQKTNKPILKIVELLPYLQAFLLKSRFVMMFGLSGGLRKVHTGSAYLKNGLLLCRP